eukprot:g43934.t1
MLTSSGGVAQRALVALGMRRANVLATASRRDMASSHGHGDEPPSMMRKIFGAPLVSPYQEMEGHRYGEPPGFEVRSHNNTFAALSIFGILCLLYIDQTTEYDGPYVWGREEILDGGYDAAVARLWKKKDE